MSSLHKLSDAGTKMYNINQRITDMNMFIYIYIYDIWFKLRHIDMNTHMTYINVDVTEVEYICVGYTYHICIYGM